MGDAIRRTTSTPQRPATRGSVTGRRPRRGRRGRMDTVKGRSVRSDAIAWTMSSCSASGIFASAAIVCDLLQPGPDAPITRQGCSVSASRPRRRPDRTQAILRWTSPPVRPSLISDRHSAAGATDQRPFALDGRAEDFADADRFSDYVNIIVRFSDILS